MHYVHKKARCGPEMATFRTKTPYFLWVIGRGRTTCPPPLGYAYAPSEENKKGAQNFSARFLAFSNEISTVQKIVLSSSRGQANFRGLETSRPRPRT